MTLVTVGYESDALRVAAQHLAAHWQLPIDNQHYPRLCVTADKLVLLVEHCSPLYVDFNSKRWQQRLDAGKKQGLVQACKPCPGLTILDATAGWGRDAAILAGFGARVLMLEKNPVMAALLQDALQRLNDSDAQRLSSNLSLQCRDANHYLMPLASCDYPDVIYLDPMHPKRSKTALVKKEMQVLQELVGYEAGEMALLQLALSKAKQRVVVKWPQRQPPLMPPLRSIKGKTVRFDVYPSSFKRLDFSDC